VKAGWRRGERGPICGRCILGVSPLLALRVTRDALSKQQSILFSPSSFTCDYNILPINPPYHTIWYWSEDGAHREEQFKRE